MRESKILKAISYVIIPILILMIILSFIYQFGKESFKDEPRYNSDFFQSDGFLSIYMGCLSEQVKSMIYYNDKYRNIIDGEIRICYKSDNTEYFYSNYNINDFYYLILYKDIAFTNVELTTETNTVEKIKTYIQNKDGKKSNILNGTVQSDSELISTKSIQYFDNFNNKYYKIINEDNTEIILKNNSENVEETVTYSNGIAEINEVEESPIIKEYYETKIEDFQIYTTYKEEINERIEELYLKNIINQLEKYESLMIYIVPISSIIVLIIVIYLIISIGHTKGKEGIDLNDLDKIPIEIILIIAGIAVPCIIALMCQALSIVNIEYYNFVISMEITGYFVTYILCAITGVTIIKRIKARCLIKDSIIGKIFIWCWSLFKKILKKVKNCYNTLKEGWPLSLKIAVGIVLYAIIAFMFLLMFNVFGLLVDLGIAVYIFYKFFEKVNCYLKIENHLKEMYEGDHSKKLESYEFTPEFQNIIKYINDVSSGFENAIQEGIKSERMKTELITNVSHDIKTPLTSIINYVDLLKKENIENEKAKEYIDILDSKSQRLKKLTEDLVEASKASSGNVKLNIEKIDICELIRQTTGEFEDKFKDKNLEILSSMPEEDIFINADNRYMYRIIENLFSNISKYALENSRVYIDVKELDKKVKIDIKNISKDKLNISAEELMQRFVRGDKSRTTEGSGLGISISKSLTELQKGKFNLNVDGDLFKVELEFDII